MKTHYSLFRKRVRFSCEYCTQEFRWFYVSRLQEMGESVEAWLEWWYELHLQVEHPDKAHRPRHRKLGRAN